jgi:hypothetical protein
MSYLVFLIVLTLAGALCGLVRLFGGKASFERVFKLIATGVVMLPVAIMSFLFCFTIAGAIFFSAGAILYATGLLPTVESWPVWSWFPRWLWIVFAPLSGFGALQLYEWMKEKRRITLR